MKTPKSKPLDAAIAVLGSGLLLGVIVRVIENSRQLAVILGF